MSSASLTAGLVGKFGQSSFTSLSGLAGGKEVRNVMPPRPPKLFKSRNIENAVAENIIVEEDTNDDENTSENQSDNDTLTASNFCTPMKTPTNTNSSTNLVVAVRVRPLMPTEKENALDIDGTQVVVAADKVFNFDHMFGPEVGQEQLYEELVHCSVEKVLDGFNATVFAYGQTGTGKTFTMGTSSEEMNRELDEERGIVTRVLQQIFDRNKQDFMTVKISFYEINKEQVYDLINPSSSKVGSIFMFLQLVPIFVTPGASAGEGGAACI